jgi:membrane protein YqaA with SNARE-associated domain
MQFFSKIYHQIIQWAKHPHAPLYLAGLSFAESSIFPIPPDFMLAPMALAKPIKAWQYAFIATTCSTLGGILGYVLGMFFFKLIYPLLIKFGCAATYQQVEHWFLVWDFWIIFLAGFTPIPYKIFTIAAGAVSMPLMPFVIASLIGRGGRFFLVAALIRLRPSQMEAFIYQYIDRAGWLLLATICLVYLGFRYL